MLHVGTVKSMYLKRTTTKKEQQKIYTLCIYILLILLNVQ